MKILLKREGSKFSSIRVSINLSLFQKKDSCAGHYPSRIHTIKRFSNPFSSPTSCWCSLRR